MSWAYPLVDGVLDVDPLADLELAAVEVEGLQVLEGGAREVIAFGARSLLQLSDGFEVLRNDLQALDARDVEAVPPLLQDASALVASVQRSVACSGEATQRAQNAREYLVLRRVAQAIFALLRRLLLRLARRSALRMRLSCRLRRLKRGDEVQHEAILQAELADEFVVVEFAASKDDALPLDSDVSFLGEPGGPAGWSA